MLKNNTSTTSSRWSYQVKTCQIAYEHIRFFLLFSDLKILMSIKIFYVLLLSTYLQVKTKFKYHINQRELTDDFRNVLDGEVTVMFQKEHVSGKLSLCPLKIRKNTLNYPRNQTKKYLVLFCFFPTGYLHSFK